MTATPASSPRPLLVAAVVVHFRGLDDTRACLASLRRAGGPPLRTWLVDNSGRGEGAALAAREFPEARALECENRGFAHACNVGIRAALEAGATHVLLVNNDAAVDPGFLAPLVEAADAPGAGLATGKVLLPGTPRRIWSAGGEYRRAAGLGLNAGEGALDGPAFDVPREVHFGTGCLLLARRDVLERAGLLDERYFLYYEDVELCERARRAGFRTRYEPRAVAVHEVHASTGGTPADEGPIATYYLTRARVLHVRRREGLLVFLAFLLRFAATRAAKMVLEVARGRPARALLIARALRDGLLGRTGRAEGVA